MSTKFENQGSGPLKRVTYFDGPQAVPLDHDGVATIDLGYEDLNVPVIESRFAACGVFVVKTSVSGTVGGGFEAHVCFRGARATVHRLLTDSTELVSDPANLKDVSFNRR